ncbi:MAG: UDP-N-acetylmuramoyl-tripeptide--D-alanyl-D-alanine ligase [Flavicella sp.]
MTLKEIYSKFKKSKGLTTDTRNIIKGGIYLALKGANFNGNNFALEALEKGAVLAIVDETIEGSNEQIIKVNDCLKTLQDLANYHRLELNIPIIALTGSNGKTTSKELINAVLSKKYYTTATQGNLNNHIGVPLTLLSMDKRTEIGIVEMGANHLNEIATLTKIIAPNYGYITNFGKAHLEGFGGVEGVIRGKSELYDYLKEKKQIAFVNPNDPLQIEKTKNIQSIAFDDKSELVPSDEFLTIKRNNTTIHTHLIGTYNFSNLQAAISIGKYFDIDETAIKEAIENYHPKNNRSQKIVKNKATIILDAYNSNPSSMKVALENFKDLKATKKIAILGDMFELGETSIEEHISIGNLAVKLGFDEIHLIGCEFSKTNIPKVHIYPSFETFQMKFKKQKATYLIKGSRGMALERVVTLF